MLASVISLVTAAVLLAVGVQTASPASATTTYLCTGYVACAQAGYTHHGYKKAGSKMWWRMYSGHNCTNYVAYMMVKSGASSERPWTGSGNAYNWGVQLSDITDSTPRVGAVAWYKANGGWAGSSGHVAYVEQVVSATEIIVSEDNWGGDFDYRVVEKGTSGWPDGFIHVNDTPLTVDTAPTVTATPAVGQKITVDPGTYTPAADEVSIQWYAAGKKIEGATSASYKPTTEQWKKRLSVRVTAKASGFARTVTDTDKTVAVRKGTLAVKNQPVVSGTAQVDGTLTTTTGTYSPAVSDKTIHWYADGTLIKGETSKKLAVTPELVDTKITAKVTATTEAYKAEKTLTTSTANVAPGVIRLGKDYTLSGTSSVGDKLAIGEGVVEWPTDATVTYQWLRGGTASGARASTSSDGSGASNDSLSYLLGAKDVGKTMGVRITIARAGYTTRTVDLAATSIVTTTPVLDLTATPKVTTRTVKVAGTKKTKTVVKRKVIVRVGVTAYGRRTVNGRVRVTLTQPDGEQQVSTVRLVDGKLRLPVTDLPRGKQTVQVDYLGTTVVTAGSARTTVRVPAS
ncbi:CHAP domain-containing protein [Nocardioides sp. GY 10127]|uniref:CHAP domain-containing protein n=1 Tax=Nocardioides sp. GY 10127 TaxID=2569762 RepID=UPI0014591A8F|nr:CHAP domain-containing protein [Nocardioides sp. GY 10127]